MNSRWQISKIGLLNFWYYDEEEFNFSEGRMLLRGSNGSGKSVTMQSFIPLLLDGNMRPERLDPFGSRARKMENYLLEENDDREERTGYLYMEYKRMDSGTYLTTGIGIRARKAKKLETWYFIIQDGRRIREDFFLYKDINNKIPLSKQELRHKIGDGGKLIENQAEYMSMINKLIFGYETIDEYKEMIELLIQLRTPKLSKEFKPTLINEILSNSLKPLSEDDLRPMSEAIENMDNLKTNLDSLKQARDAAKKIARVYDRYNQFMLFEKARQYKECADTVKGIEKDIKAYKEAVRENERAHNEAEDRLERLKTEEKVLKEEENSLNQSDAKRLKENELSLETEKKDKTKELAVKNNNLSEKKDKHREAENKRKSIEEESEKIKDDIGDCLNGMKDTLVNITFDEHSLMAAELVKELEKDYNFNMHAGMLEKLIDKVDEGIILLSEEERLKKSYDLIFKALEKTRSDKDAAERESMQLENQFLEIKGELLEKIYAWNENNEVLIADKEHLSKAAVMVENYSDKSDYSDIKEILRPDKEIVLNSILHDISYVNNKKLIKEDEIKKENEELLRWKNAKDPEPERSAAILQSRRKLKEKGIEFVEFYKAVDFEERMPPKMRDYVEEALNSMGILDALIVSSEDREAILQLDKGMCDKYIFDDISSVKNNMNEWMNIVNPDNDLNSVADMQDVNIFIYQKISNILSGIGCQGGLNSEADKDKNSNDKGIPAGLVKEAHTALNEDGSYRLGILTGTITREYQAKFIGVKRREEYRQAVIKDHEDRLFILNDERESILGELVRLEAKRELLEQEWSDFPKGDDLKTAFKLLKESLQKIERLAEEFYQKEDLIKEEQAKLDKVRECVLNVSGRLYLKARLDLFKDAKKDLYDYQKLFNQLQINHTKYLSHRVRLRQYEDQLNELEWDIDNLLYDIGRIKRDLEEISRSLESINEQLKLTDYEQIKERLNYCMERLRKIPEEMKRLYKQSQSAVEHMSFNKNAGKEKEALFESYYKKCRLTEELFLKENQLKYSGLVLPEVKNNYSLCVKTFQSLEGTFVNKRREDYNRDLQEVFHANKGMLPEYYLMQEYLFSEYDEDNAYADLYFKRIDITAKYRGTLVKFHELLVKIEGDIEEQNSLLNQKDRELFEDILADTISKKIRAKIYAGMSWVENMNKLMNSMRTSSGLTLSLRWKSKKAEHEEQLDTKNLVELLKKDAEIMKEEDFEKLSVHFRSKMTEARRTMEEDDIVKSFHSVMREILDYRNWFEFQLEFQMIGETKKELTDRAFYIFSGGEKAMAMYVPLFSAVTAKYKGARQDAPRLISLDEAFAGVDETNIRDMYRLMVEFEFSFIINSQILWGDADTLPSIAIYQLIRPENVKFVTVIPYLWNGKSRICLDEA